MRDPTRTWPVFYLRPSTTLGVECSVPIIILLLPPINISSSHTKEHFSSKPICPYWKFELSLRVYCERDIYIVIRVTFSENLNFGTF